MNLNNGFSADFFKNDFNAFILSLIVFNLILLMLFLSDYENVYTID